MSQPSLSVVIASGGRPSLSQTLASIVPQLSVYDEFLVVGSQREPWGHGSRNRAMPWCTGDLIGFCDDDDEWVPKAIPLIRAAAKQQPKAVHVFAGRTVVVPNREPFGRWDGEADGLSRFVEQMGKRRKVVEWPAALVVVP